MRLLAPLLILVVILAGCATSNDSTSGPARFADVHGLAVDPNDPRVLYVATHHGLFRGVDGKDWAKVGTETMDLMGFTMHPTDPNVFYASGHPARPSRDYNALGVIKSTDGGHAWTTVALRNQVDFHAMTISLAEPNRVWGYYYRDNHFYESHDAGANWTHYAPTQNAPQITSIASNADSATTVYAGTNDGIWTSRDLGKTWARLAGNQPSGPAGTVATTKADANIVWAYFPSAGVMHTSDGGATWTLASPLPVGSQDGPSAIDPTSPETVYVASGRGAVYKSTGGAWSQIQYPAS